jgi:hypothetical protein
MRVPLQTCFSQRCGVPGGQQELIINVEFKLIPLNLLLINGKFLKTPRDTSSSMR